MKAYSRWRMGLAPFLMVLCWYVAGMVWLSTAWAAVPGESPPAEGAVSVNQPAVAMPANPPDGSPVEEAVLCPPPPVPRVSIDKAREDLLRENFNYSLSHVVDPFVPFVKLGTPAAVAAAARKGNAASADDSGAPPETVKLFTPLQKMSLGEIEKGLKAIVWGAQGRRAVIEDGAGRGYIVSVGTPAGDNNGTVSEIFNDRVVIQQNFWDRKQKQYIPQNTVVRLKKGKI